MLPLSTDDFGLFQRLLIETSGLYFTPDRSQPLHLALWQRLQHRGYNSYREYFNLLKYHPEGRFELRELLDLITIGETYFFRNKAQFEVLLKYVLPQIVQRKKYLDNKCIRVWSAGCSGGDEPYSIAIAILETVPSYEGLNISILGTDINRNELNRAREGVYGERSINQLPKEYLEKHFEIQGATYRLKDNVKGLVQFEYHNLASDPYIHERMKEIDLLFCRNVIIYFEGQTTERVINNFYNCLAPHGYLFLGHTETLWQIPNELEKVEFPQAFIYQRRFHPDPENPLHPFMALPEITLHSLPSVNNTFTEPRGFSKDPMAGHQIKLGSMEQNEESRGLAESFFDLKEMDSEYMGHVWNTFSLPSHLNVQDDIDVRTYLTQATLLANEARYKEAVEALIKVIEIDRLNIEAYYLLGILYCKNMEFKEAETQFRKVIYLDRNSVLAYYHLGNIYLFQKRLTEAVREFGNAIRLLEKKPKDEQVRLGEDVTPDLLLRACRKNLAEISKRGNPYEGTR
jgi:chemotaxis protein methyltransferase CheR